MKANWSLAVLALAVSCGEPWVTLGQRAPADSAVPDTDAAAAAESEAGPLVAPSDNDAAVAVHPNDTEHACSDTTQCTSGGHPFCDTTQGVCVRCLRDLDCESPDRCLAGDCVSSD